MRKRLHNQAARGLPVHGKSGGRSPAGDPRGTNRSLSKDGGLVLDRDEIGITPPAGAKGQDRTVSHAPYETDGRDTGPRDSFWKKVLCCFFCVAVVGSGIFVYLSSPMPASRYRAESKLQFIPVDQENNQSGQWPLVKEANFLRDPKVAWLAAQELYQGASQRHGSTAEATIQPVSATAADSALANSKVAGFHSPAELAKWISDGVSMETSLAGGSAHAALRMQGDDPQFLKMALDTYVKAYVVHRADLESTTRDQIRPAAHRADARDARVEACPPELLCEYLRKLEMQERSIQLALQLLDSQKGSFGGFVPDAGFGGSSSLKRFQERIVELEIKKRGLLVQFTPNSREVKIIDQEIQSIRQAMRDCLAEYVRFLKKDKEALALQYPDLQPGKGALSSSEAKVGPARYTGQLPNGDTWFLVRDGLYVVADKPCVEEVPMMTRGEGLRKAARNALNRLFGAPPTNGTPRKSVPEQMVRHNNDGSTGLRAIPVKVDAGVPPSTTTELTCGRVCSVTLPSDGADFYPVFTEPKVTPQSTKTGHSNGR